MKHIFLTVPLLLLALQGGPHPAQAQEPLHLTLAEAEQLSVKNNPQLSASLLNAAAALQVPLQYRAAYLPTLSGNVTGAVAEPGSRIAAGGAQQPLRVQPFRRRALG